jgi:putative restriction endonuclease
MTYQGRRITLIGPQGIWFPKGFEIPLSITTVVGGPYDDGTDEYGFVEYRYRGTDPNHRDNVGLRRAYERRTPLVYFQSFKPGKYQAMWPMFILEDHPAELRVKAAVDPAYAQAGQGLSPYPAGAPLGGESELGVRRYATALMRQRLHQSAFREFVLDAYSRQCTMCALQHAELLDAAHIIPDSEQKGDTVVQNGLSLCKIHHAAYDRNIIGITPNFVVNVREDVLNEVDGPMLKYGLQSLQGQSLHLPKRKVDYPDRDRLEVRYREFVS